MTKYLAIFQSGWTLHDPDAEEFEYEGDPWDYLFEHRPEKFVSSVWQEVPEPKLESR